MPLQANAALNKDKRTGLSPMQHRHYTSIATVIREEDWGWSLDAHDIRVLNIKELVARRFANRLRETNPNFDEDRFLRACGL